MVTIGKILLQIVDIIFCKLRLYVLLIDSIAKHLSQCAEGFEYLGIFIHLIMLLVPHYNFII